MQISRENGFLGRDCQIPARFIKEEMKLLDFRALKLYLFLHLMTLEGDVRVNDQLLRQELGFSENDLSESVTLLLRRGLLKARENTIELSDYHRLSAERMSRENTQRREQSQLGTDEERKRSEIVRQINDTYFQGNMPIYFYRSIENWFAQYHFAPEVVYALIQEASRYNQLRSSDYADAIALNWSRSGVRSFSDLNRYMEERQRDLRYAELVSKKLGIGRLNEYQMQALKRWTDEWGFDEGALEEAMERASMNGKPSFQYIEAILRDWHQAGVHETEDILLYEEKRRARKTGGSARAAARSPIGNFEQREYHDEDYESLVYIPGLSEEGEKESGEL